MTLSYRILWVDDTPDWVNSVKGQVEEHLRGQGYQPVIDVYESGDEIEQQCAATDLDLIIIDYNLPTEKGNKIISRVRAAGNFTEVVFYSQALDQMERDSSFQDGVFRCARGDAAETIERVIDVTLHKLRDVSVVRGLVIATAIDLEVKIEDLMVTAFAESGTLFRRRILEKPFWLDFKKKLDFLTGHVKDKIKEYEDGEDKRALQAAKDILGQFNKEVINTRNRLAHAKSIEKDGRIILEDHHGGRGYISPEWVAKVRTDLQRHRKNLESLERLLS